MECCHWLKNSCLIMGVILCNILCYSNHGGVVTILHQFLGSMISQSVFSRDLLTIKTSEARQQNEALSWATTRAGEWSLYSIAAPRDNRMTFVRRLFSIRISRLLVTSDIPTALSSDDGVDATNPLLMAKVVLFSRLPPICFLFEVVAVWGRETHFVVVLQTLIGVIRTIFEFGRPSLGSTDLLWVFGPLFGSSVLYTRS